MLSLSETRSELNIKLTSVLHSLYRLRFPIQYRPWLAGLGLSHLRSAKDAPPPHVREHSDHELHSPHWPLMASGLTPISTHLPSKHHCKCIKFQIILVTKLKLYLSAKVTMWQLKYRFVIISICYKGIPINLLYEIINKTRPNIFDLCIPFCARYLHELEDSQHNV
jgi:hypothetical protein